MNIKDKLNIIKFIKRTIIERKVLSLISNIGIKLEDNLELEIIDKNNFSSIDPNTVYYYYDGPLDDKTRNFCAELLLLGKFFTQKDIDNLSKASGYNVDLYNGSYNCRHKWKMARIKGRISEGYIPNGPTTTQINKIGKQSI